MSWLRLAQPTSTQSVQTRVRIAKPPFSWPNSPALPPPCSFGHLLFMNLVYLSVIVSLELCEIMSLHTCQLAASTPPNLVRGALCPPSPMLVCCRCFCWNLIYYSCSRCGACHTGRSASNFRDRARVPRLSHLRVFFAHVASLLVAILMLFVFLWSWLALSVVRTSFL